MPALFAYAAKESTMGSLLMIEDQRDMLTKKQTSNMRKYMLL